MFLKGMTHLAIELEYEKCKNDIVYFAETYCKTDDPSKPGTSIVLLEKKRKFLRALANNDIHKIIALGYRQCGKTTLAIIFALWKMYFFPNSHVVIVSARKIMASTIYGRLMKMVDNLPEWMNFRLNKKANELGRFNNGSKFVSTCSPESLRGMSVDVLFVDELAYFNSPEKEETINLNTSVYSYFGKVIYISSASKNTGLFYKTWKIANSINPCGWEPFEFTILDMAEDVEFFKRWVENVSPSLLAISENFQKQEFLNVFLPETSTT